MTEHQGVQANRHPGKEDGMADGQATVTFYREWDADPRVLADQVVAVIGYGNLGRSMALNLRDSGMRVVVGNREDGYRATVAADGFEVGDIDRAVAAADIVFVLLPDEVIPACFLEEIEANLRPGAALCFASGYVLAYKLVAPPARVDVLLLAPRMLGEEVRRTYLDETGFLSYVSVEQDATGSAKARLLALARVAGSLHRGALELPAEQEALLDLFVEQSLGPYLGLAMQLAFQIGVEAGMPAEALVLELYMSGEMARTLQTFADQGFFGSVKAHGLTAEYGGFIRTLEVDREAMETRFRTVLEEIRDGTFATRLQQEQANEYPTLTLIDEMTNGTDPMSEAERHVRAALAPPPPDDAETA
jgi:ketol-acid reductoisomerase